MGAGHERLGAMFRQNLNLRVIEALPALFLRLARVGDTDMAVYERK